MERNKNLNNRWGSRVIGGLIIIAVGAALLLRNIGFYMPHWYYLADDFNTARYLFRCQTSFPK